MKTTSRERYYVSFKSFFGLSDALEHDLKNGWNFYLVWKLRQEGNIT